MALRRMAASMLSRTFTSAAAAAPRGAAGCSGTVHLLSGRLAAQLTSLLHLSSASPAPSMWRSGGSRVYSTPSNGYGPPMGLAEALQAELEYEHDNYEAPEDLSQPPTSWTVMETPGDAQLTLTRQYNGETVEVIAQCDVRIPEHKSKFPRHAQPHCDHEEDGTDAGEHPLAGMPPAEDEQTQQMQAQLAEEDLDVGINATARVTKGNRSVEISFNTDGESVTVVDVSLGPPDVKVDDDTAYAGPRFEELDENVQRSFDAFLEERGVDAELGEFLMKALEDKEQREYVGWMQKLHDFAKS